MRKTIKSVFLARGVLRKPSGEESPTPEMEETLRSFQSLRVTL